MRGLQVKVRHEQRNRKINPLLPDHRDHNPYIYFLINKNKVVYVGQSKSLRNRIHFHNCYKIYNKIRIIKCDVERLNYYERRWIARFKPKYNSQTFFIKRIS